MPENAIAALRDWWPFGFALGAAFIAYITGRERQRWRVDELGKAIEENDRRAAERMGRLESQFADMQRSSQAENVSLAKIEATQSLILDALTEMRAEIRGKADK